MVKITLEEKDIVVTVQSIAAVMGCSIKNITTYVRKGMPYIEVGKRREYRVKECIFWALSNGYLKLPINIDTEVDVEELPPNIRKDLADAKLKELKLQKEKDEVVYKSDVVADATRVSMSWRERLFSLPDRLSTELASETNPREINKILWREFRKLVEDVVSEFMD